MVHYWTVFNLVFIILCFIMIGNNDLLKLKKQGHCPVSKILLYEPRMLVRSLAQHLIDGRSRPLWLHQVSTPYIEDIRNSVNKDMCVLVGVGGVGPNFSEVLRLFRYLKIMKINTIAWIPSGYLYLSRLLNAVGVNEILIEDDLPNALMVTLQKMTTHGDTAIKRRRVPDLSQTELDILLQFSAGLSAKDISIERGCCYKTVFSWKHNIYTILEIKTPDQWLTMLAEMAQISTLYQQR